ncbi:MAG: MlaD family protein [Syntrophobacteraceae bacterium]
MSKQANTKLIGGFVVGAIVLVVAGVLLFGSGKLFSKQRKFVLFFTDSVKGLSIGAPVDFKGVKVGSVTDVRIVLDRKDLSLGIPVFIEFDPRKISVSGTMSEMVKVIEERLKGQNKFLGLLVSQGLKAQLEMQSIVTGQLGIHLDFFPDEPVRLVGKEPEYPEIPTVESSLSELMKTVANLPITEIANKISKALDGIDNLVNSPDIKEALASLHPTINAAHTLLQNLDSQVKPLATGADITLSEAKKMFANASKLAAELDVRVPRITAGLEDTLKTAGVTMRGANKAIDGMTGDNSPVRRELIRTLNEFASAARSIRVLADYIENNPQAFIMGKGKGK